MKSWFVGGYLDSSIKIINGETGKVDKSITPTGDVITALETSKNIIAAGTMKGEVLLWVLEINGILNKKTKISAYLDSPVISLVFNERTPLLIAATNGGEILIINCVDSKVMEKLELTSFKKPTFLKVH